MLAMELRGKMSDLESKVASTKQSLDQFIQKRNAVDPSTSLTELERLTEEIRSHEKRLETFELLRLAIAKKLRQYDANKGEAAKLRQETTSLYDEARTLIEKTIIPAQRSVAPAVVRIDTINAEIRARAEKHLQLTGEDMNEPPPIMVYAALRFAGPGAAGVQGAVEPIKVPEPWSYVSETEHVAERDKELKEKLKAHEARVKVAEEFAPPCPQCGTNPRVDRRSGHIGAGGYAGSWHLTCPKCHAIWTTIIPQTK
jgi:hypothetical protein